MQASKTVLTNAKALLENRDYIIAIDLTPDQAIEIKEQLVRNGKLSQEVIDWVHSNMPYFPRTFLDKDAIYEVETKDDKSCLKFSMFIFSPISFMSLMMQVDEMSGGFTIAQQLVDNGVEDFLEEEDAE